MGRLLGLLLRRYARQRLQPYAPQRYGMRGLRRLPAHAHHRRTAVRPAGLHAAEPAVRLGIPPRHRDGRTGLLLGLPRPLRREGGTHRHETGRAAPLYLPGLGPGGLYPRPRLLSAAPDEPRHAGGGDKRHGDTRLQAVPLLGPLPAAELLCQVLETVHVFSPARHADRPEG